MYGQLGLRDSAIGILRHSEALLLSARKAAAGAAGSRRRKGQRRAMAGVLRPSWLEKIHQWEKALALYEAYVEAVEGEGEEEEGLGGDGEGKVHMQQRRRGSTVERSSSGGGGRDRRVSSSSSSSSAAAAAVAALSSPLHHHRYSVTHSRSGRHWTIQEEEGSSPIRSSRPKAASMVSPVAEEGSPIRSSRPKTASSAAWPVLAGVEGGMGRGAGTRPSSLSSPVRPRGLTGVSCSSGIEEEKEEEEEEMGMEG